MQRDAMRIFGVILAGGEGRRMGGVDKALVPFRGRPLVDHVTDRLEPQVERLAIAANGDPARFSLPVLHDEEAVGPLSGVLSGLRWARDAGADAIVTCAVDMPFLAADLVPMLCWHWPAPAVADSGKMHPTCALWPVGAEPALARFLADGHRRVRDFAARIGAQPVAFSDPRAFLNLNTPEDLAQAEAMP